MSLGPGLTLNLGVGGFDGEGSVVCILNHFHVTDRIVLQTRGLLQWAKDVIGGGEIQFGLGLKGFGRSTCFDR